MEDARLRSIWHNMKTRCYNQNSNIYKWYGKKGIKVCDDWKNSFAAFVNWALSNGYSENLTLDRIDTHGDYCPENCRWVSRKSQANNRIDNHLLIHNDTTQTIQQWSDETGMTHGCISQRIQAGWSTDRALTEPVHDTHTPRYITFNGVTKRLYEWAKELGMRTKTLRNRIDLHGWTVEEALTIPIGGRR